MGERNTRTAHEARAVSRFLDGWAGAFAAVAVERFMTSHYFEAIAPSGVAVTVFLAGVCWPRIAEALGPGASMRASAVATDLRSWVVLLVLLFIYLGSPRIIESLAPPPTQVTTIQTTAPPSPQPISPTGTVKETPPESPKEVVLMSPSSLKTLTNEELRDEAFVVAQALHMEEMRAITEQTAIEYDKSISESTRAQRTIASESKFNKVIREKYLTYCRSLQREMLNRLTEKPNYSHLERIEKNDDIVDPGNVGGVADDLRDIARKLR